MMGDAPDWPSNRTAGVRLSATARLGQRPETMSAMGAPTPVTFTFVRSWIQE